MRMCGDYGYLTTRYSYPPKRAVFLLLPNLLLFLTVKILIPGDEQYFCRKNPHTLANALKSVENTGLEKSLVLKSVENTSSEKSLVSKLFSKLIFFTDFSAFANVCGFCVLCKTAHCRYASAIDTYFEDKLVFVSKRILIIEQSIRYSRYHRIIPFKCRFPTKTIKIPAQARLLL